MSRDDDPERLLEKLFGPVVYSYPDSQAIEDGVLIPFVANNRDTRHRMTNNAFHELKQHYKERRAYNDYADTDFYRFFFNEFIVLVPYAVREYQRGGILETDFDFKVGRFSVTKSDRLWYLPNEVGGVTMMKPEDY